jgi:hypothetical protein
VLAVTAPLTSAPEGTRVVLEDAASAGTAAVSGALAVTTGAAVAGNDATTAGTAGAGADEAADAPEAAEALAAPSPCGTFKTDPSFNRLGS